jgi:aromatic-L-amino-acid decarboxylase
LKPAAGSSNPSFALDEKTRLALGHQLTEIINSFYSSLSDRPVQLPLEQRSFAPLSNQMPETPSNPAKALEEISAALIAEGFHVPSANYFGLMNPAPTYVAVLAEALVAALNPQLATQNRSQLAAKIEDETVRWIGERVGWKVPFAGTFTSGGNEANFSALALALTKHFPSIVEDGVAPIGSQPVFYASTESHHSLDKSAGLLGLGRKALRRIPVDANIRLDLVQLEAAIAKDKAAGQKPFCVVATAGTTNSGAIDDLTAVAGICKRHNLWLHVDGAYGAGAIFSDQHRNLVKGIELADSVTIDPHKWLAMPFAAGVVLTCHPELLEQTFGTHTPYMPKADGSTRIDNFKVSTQWSRRMNSLKLWLTLRVHGRQAYEQHIDRQLGLARWLTTRLTSENHFELAAPQILPIINLRARLSASATEEQIAAANAAIVDEVTRSGDRWISVTSVNGRSVIRIMVISYFTEQEQLEELVGAMESAAERLRSQASSAR